MPAADLVALTLADARFPSGGYAQSAGLEAAVRAGLDADDLFAYAGGRLRTVVTVDAGTAVVARHLVLHETDRLDRVVEAWAARTPSAALREVARLTGRGYLRVASRVWPDVIPALAAVAKPPRPVVVGAVAAVTDLSSVALARVVAYDDLATVCAAALKLLPLDPAEVAAGAVALHPLADETAESVAGLTDPDDIPDRGAPLVDEHAEAHARAETRLFRG